MFVLARKAGHLGYFSLSDLVSVDPTDADALLVDMQHDAGRLLGRLVEVPLEHIHHEVHRRIVVVQQQHLVEARPLRLRPCLGGGMGGGVLAPRRGAGSPPRRGPPFRAIVSLYVASRSSSAKASGLALRPSSSILAASRRRPQIATLCSSIT